MEVQLVASVILFVEFGAKYVHDFFLSDGTSTATLGVQASLNQ